MRSGRIPSDEYRIAFDVDGFPDVGGAAATGAATNPAVSAARLNRTVARIRTCDVTGLLLLDEPWALWVGRREHGPGADPSRTAPDQSGLHTIASPSRSVTVR